jgi:hypothetical protein
LRRGDPARSFRSTLRNALTLGVHTAEQSLRKDVSLLCGLSEPSGGFGIILRSALTILVHEPEQQLCFGNSPLGR